MKQALVFHGKSEESGLLEPQVAVTLNSSLQSKLFSLTAEELFEIEKLGPRISSYFELYEARLEAAREEHASKQVQEELLSMALNQS
eukprot:g12671.t1